MVSKYRSKVSISKEDNSHNISDFIQKKVAEDRFNNFILICVIQDIVQIHIKKFTYKKKIKIKIG